MAPAHSGATGVTGLPAAPYLSVVVTTRNDDHGGDPLRRLQAFVNTFARQCARTGLDAELIVVEWNPPDDRPRLSQLLRVPSHAPFPVRLVEVPAAIHETFRFAAVLPLFQMIAKNAGIRRARGRFVLATNIDIIFSTELVEHLASGQLEPGHLYRVDRHDIEAAFPVDAPLDEQMEYCRTHHLRLHTRSGSHAVDPCGRVTSLDSDVVGSAAVKLGEGWHMREGDAATGFKRWVTREAHVSIDRTVEPDLARGVVLDVEVEPNAYEPDSWIDLEILDGERRLTERRLTRRTRLRFGLDDDVARHEVIIRTTGTSSGREWLPLLERRDELCCCVYQVAVRSIPRHDYDLRFWRRASNENPALRVQHTPSGIDVTSDPDRYSYCAQYAPFEAPADGTYEFELECRLIEGHCALAVMDDERECWLPSSVGEAEGDGVHVLSLTVDLVRGTKCSLFIANDRPRGGQSHVVLRRLRGSAPLERLVRGTDRSPEASRVLPSSAVAIGAGLRRLLGSALLRRPVRGTDLARGMSQDAMADESDRVRALEARIASLTPLADLAPLARLIREYRPATYQNAAGDFQLMAREHWFTLRGYPEIEMFSMNVDGLFEAIAHAAGICEQVWNAPLCVYHLEHEKGSGFTPEGEALLKARIAKSGITWLDAGAVQILSTYMQWLRRPMIFNEAGWGLCDAVLQETVVPARLVTIGPAPS
jgi:hypothetical protein